MTTFNTARWGQIKVDKDCVINAPLGLIGFSKDNRFVILEDGSQIYMQSVDNSFLALPVIEKGYTFDLPAGAKETLKIENISNPKLIVFCVMDRSKVTINMQAPILYSIDNRTLMQVSLIDSNFSVDAPIYNSYSVHDRTHVSQQHGKKPDVRGKDHV